MYLLPPEMLVIIGFKLLYVDPVFRITNESGVRYVPSD